MRHHCFLNYELGLIGPAVCAGPMKSFINVGLNQILQLQRKKNC